MFETKKRSLPGFVARLRKGCAVFACVLLYGTFFGCHPTPEAAVDRGSVGRSPLPIDADPAFAEQVGREALATIGYGPLMSLARQAGWVTIKDQRTNRIYSRAFISMDPAEEEAVRVFVEVFSSYAVTAGVASQADTPLPGPADIIAIGILAIGLVNAGMVAVAALNAAGHITFPTTGSAPVTTTMPVATTKPTVDAPPIPISLTETDKEKKERCKRAKDVCIADCTRKLPTSDFGFQFWNCVNKCMADEGCIGY